MVYQLSWYRNRKRRAAAAFAASECTENSDKAKLLPFVRKTIAVDFSGSDFDFIA